jgi:hypothetical protein
VPANDFLTAIRSFQAADVGQASKWQRVIQGFDEAFRRARIDRAALTPRLNVLEIFGLKRWENYHSQVVAWFLDADASHEQGGLFMRALLSLCGANVQPTEPYTVQTEKPDRVDVAAFQSRRFAVFIENKVDHHERPDQLADLQRSLIKWAKEWRVPEECRFAVFLTEDGRSPNTHCSSLPEFLQCNLKSLNRVEVFEAFRNALKPPEIIKSPLLETFLDGYINAISSH